jgi:hypothetical protein
MFQIKHPGLVRLSPCQYDEQAFFTESSTLVTEFVVQKTGSNVSIWKHSGAAWCVLNAGLLKMSRSSKCGPGVTAPC